MSNTKFLIAKYIQDLNRLEPRNIGVIVWSEGNIAARFLGEINGTIESIVAPRYLRVPNQSMYRQWIEYWRYQISQQSLSLNGNGNLVDKNSPHFLDALKRCSKQQFLLLEGGFLKGEFQKGEIQDIVDDLFENLVEDKFISDKKEEEGESLAHLKKTIDQAFDDSGIKRSRDFSHNLSWMCSVEGNKYPFVFDYALYTNRPKVLFQRVILTRQSSVHNAAFMFNCMSNSDQKGFRVSKNQCVSLVHTTENLLLAPNVPQELTLLSSYCDIIDLASFDQAVNKLQSIAA